MLPIPRNELPPGGAPAAGAPPEGAPSGTLGTESPGPSENNPAPANGDPGVTLSTQTGALVTNLVAGVPAEAADIVSLPSSRPFEVVSPLLSGGDQAIDANLEAFQGNLFFLPILQDPLRFYLADNNLNGVTPRDSLDATILGLPPGAAKGADTGPTRLHSIEQAGYLLSSSLNQADDNALNVERLLRRQSETTPVALPRPDPEQPIQPAPEEDNHTDEETVTGLPLRTSGVLARRLGALAAGALGLANFLGGLATRSGNRERPVSPLGKGKP